MNRRRSSFIGTIILPLVLAACANGDFDRVRPSLVTDNIHAWVGRDAARDAGAPISAYPLTDNEKRLRDFAYPLIEPPYDRNRWYSVVNEYGLSRFFNPDWTSFNPAVYFRTLDVRCARSQVSRYAQLNTDIRNDIARIPPFSDIARRVLDMDARREKSLGYVQWLSQSETANAIARNAENELVVVWAQRSLAQRVESYRYALERLVIAVPSAEAVEVENSLTLLQQRIAESRIVVEPPIVGLEPIGPIVSK